MAQPAPTGEVPRRRLRRCPVQSSTPLGPDQVNVLFIIIGSAAQTQGQRKEGGHPACGSLRKRAPNGYPKFKSEQSWKLATGRGRLRANGYVCDQ
jgi:hypothetical protein